MFDVGNGKVINNVFLQRLIKDDRLRIFVEFSANVTSGAKVADSVRSVEWSVSLPLGEYAALTWTDCLSHVSPMLR